MIYRILSLQLFRVLLRGGWRKRCCSRMCCTRLRAPPQRLASVLVPLAAISLAFLEIHWQLLASPQKQLSIAKQKRIQFIDNHQERCVGYC
jgi:hypothetical protein